MRLMYIVMEVAVNGIYMSHLVPMIKNYDFQFSQSEDCKRQLQYSSAKSKGNTALVLTLINIVYTAVTVCLVIGLSVGCTGYRYYYAGCKLHCSVSFSQKKKKQKKNSHNLINSYLRQRATLVFLKTLVLYNVLVISFVHCAES